MNFYECVKWLQTMLEVPLNDEDANFTRIIPAMFAYADGRIYRELDFLQTTNTDKIVAPKGERRLVLPSRLMSVRSLSMFTPGGVVPPPDPVGPPHTLDVGKRVDLERVTPEALNMFWPTTTKLGVPRQYALIGQRTQYTPPPPPPPPIGTYFDIAAILAPTPNTFYVIEWMGFLRPELLSAKNPETFISVIYPELFLACCMVFGCGYQRDWGAQSDDPQKAVSWESQYQTLKASAQLEAAKLRGEGPSFTALSPAQLAQQPRAP